MNRGHICIQYQQETVNSAVDQAYVISQVKYCLSSSPKHFTMPDQTTQVKLWGGRFTGKTDPLYMFCDSGYDWG